jgi:aspartyl-tRNA synthetase
MEINLSQEEKYKRVESENERIRLTNYELLSESRRLSSETNSLNFKLISQTEELDNMRLQYSLL